MNARFRARLILLVVSIAATAGLTIWGVHHSWDRIRALEQRLASGFESFRLAGEFQDRLFSLNHSMRHFVARRDARAWSDFDATSVLLDRWLEEQSTTLQTERERDVFRRLNEAYDEYITAARRLPGSVRTEPDVLADADLLGGLEQREQRLIGLVNQLNEAHREAEEAFLASANVSFGHLRTFLFADVAALLGLTGGLGWVIYRDLVAPMRVRLVHSEALLERQEKLATLGTLSAGIAHEIRNPLTSIRARLYTLGKHIKGNEPGLSDAAIISNEITRLEQIVQEVLQFARPSEPRLEMVFAETPLRDVQKLMTGTLEKSNVKLVLEEGTNPRVPMDVSLMKQVLINLVRNAAEAIDGEGTVTMRARAGRVRLNARIQDVVILEVADSGRGILPEVERRLFDPFFSTKQSGTGLGLSIAARIVEKHGGALQYQTVAGHGTTFGIVLPIACEPARADESSGGRPVD